MAIQSMLKTVHGLPGLAGTMRETSDQTHAPRNGQDE